MGEAALQWTPQSHAGRPRILANLGIASLNRFEQVGDLGDLGKSVVTLEEALQRTTQDTHLDEPGIRVHLGHAYFWRFERGDALADLDRAISVMGDASRVGGYAREPWHP
jgi:hypothetical protein